MEDVLNLWDGIFAKDPSLNICIFIGLALLLRIRDEREYIDGLSDNSNVNFLPSGKVPRS